MIYDKENAFIFDKDVSTTPDVIANGMGGNAGDELFLAAKFASPLTTAAVITLKTADTADTAALDSADTLCTLTIPVGAQKGFIKVPYGAKKYYGISVTGPTSGKCTIAMTLDSELE